MAILSWRMAFIKFLWYFITGHWPVCIECDLDQPRPIRIERFPVCAAASTPPGSSVT